MTEDTKLRGISHSVPSTGYAFYRERSSVFELIAEPDTVPGFSLF
jgi:hypothetical protein